MSLDSGITLCRLNHELFPEPGKPIARTTTPFGGRGTAGTWAGAFGVTATAGSAGRPTKLRNSPSGVLRELRHQIRPATLGTSLGPLPLEQKPAPRLAPVLGHRARDLPGDGDYELPKQHSWKLAEKVQLRLIQLLEMHLQKVPGLTAQPRLQAQIPANWRECDEPAAPPALRRGKLFRVRWLGLRRPGPRLGLRRNKLVVKGAEQVDRRELRVSFCDAASGRASICACKAFNTETSAGSIGEGQQEPFQPA